MKSVKKIPQKCHSAMNEQGNGTRKVCYDKILRIVLENGTAHVTIVYCVVYSSPQNCTVVCIRFFFNRLLQVLL